MNFHFFFLQRNRKIFRSKVLQILVYQEILKLSSVVTSETLSQLFVRASYIRLNETSNAKVDRNGYLARDGIFVFD